MGCRFRNKYVSEKNGKVIFVCDNEENCVLFCESEEECPLKLVK